MQFYLKIIKKFGSPDLGQRMIDFLPKVKSVIETCCKNPGRGKISSVNLGDAWYNNFLFRSASVEVASLGP